jgi:hypothetical protein
VIFLLAFYGYQMGKLKPSRSSELKTAFSINTFFILFNFLIEIVTINTEGLILISLNFKMIILFTFILIKILLYFIIYCLILVLITRQYLYDE